jgi:hypothetical protein
VYAWWVFVHLVGVFGFLLAHGVSMGVIFRIRRERDPARVVALLDLSTASIQAFYVAFLVLLVGGVVAGVQGHWFSQVWLWIAIGILVITTGAMYGMARPYTRRVGLIARALASGSEAVSREEFEGVLRSSRPWSIAGVGSVGLALILFLMVVKPTFSLGGGGGALPACTPASSGPDLSIRAKDIAFSTACLGAPAGRAITLTFANDDAGVPHNVAVYREPSVTYHLPALAAGSYLFRCDVHPFMKGTLVVGGGSASP